jgi:hypothetical protein
VEQAAEFESQEDVLMRDESTEKHPLAYRDVWALYDNFRKLGRKAEGEKEAFEKRLKRKLEDRIKQKLIQSGGNVRLRSYVKDNVPSLIYGQIIGNRQSVSFVTKDLK